MAVRNSIPGEERAGQGALLRALGHRNYRLFFVGQSISLIGTWMQQTAVLWLAYRMTQSAFVPGLVTFCGQIPTFFLAPVFGVLTDRWNRHRTLVATQVLSMLQAVALFSLTAVNLMTVAQLVLLSLVLGIINALDMPVRQSFLIDMVEERGDLSNAIALNSTMVNSARLLGPATAGFLIGWLGEWWCFLLNALSFVPVVAALLAMRVGKPALRSTRPGVLQDLREGVVYAFGFPPIRDILLLLGLMSMGGMPLLVLMPVFASQVLHGGAYTFGLLSAALGLGAFVGGLLLAMRKSVLGLGRHVARSSAGFGLAMLLFAISHSQAVSVLALIVAGYSMISQMAASNTILQTIVEDDKRGRVMSLYAVAFRGTAPIGSLLAGAAASHLGVAVTTALGGLACLAGALVFHRRLGTLRTMIRPIYQRMGILPQTPSGSEPGSELTVPPRT